MHFLVKEALEILNRPRNILKIPNIFLVSLSFLICKITKKNAVFGYPFMLMLEPTNICNLRCPLCITGSKLMTRKDGTMPLENYKELINEMGRYLVHLTLWSQGEPFVNRDFMEMVKYASERGIRTMTSTNGHFLTENAEEIVESGLDVLIVAVDGASQETYEKYRVNGNFQKVYNGMKAVSEAKKRKRSKTPELELQFIVMKHNEHEFEAIRKLALECGAQVLSFKTAQIYTKEQAAEFLPENEKYRRYELSSNGEIKTRTKEINFCRWVLLCPVINWDGTVSPCCFDKNAEYGLGNVFSNGGLKKIWRAPAYAEFRKQIFAERKKIPICSNCSEGLEVEVFEKEAVVA
jgi:radical SAM protein with 4Fe4S-binding SPASM domain